jgi:hypothetical protein
MRLLDAIRQMPVLVSQEFSAQTESIVASGTKLLEVLSMMLPLPLAKFVFSRLGRDERDVIDGSYEFLKLHGVEITHSKHCDESSQLLSARSENAEVSGLGRQVVQKLEPTVQRLKLRRENGRVFEAAKESQAARINLVSGIVLVVQMVIWAKGEQVQDIMVGVVLVNVVQLRVRASAYGTEVVVLPQHVILR